MDWRRLIDTAIELVTWQQRNDWLKQQRMLSENKQFTDSFRVATKPTPPPPQPGDLTPIGLNPKIILYQCVFFRCPECGGQLLKLAWSDTNLLDLGATDEDCKIGPVCAHCLTVPFDRFVGVGR